MFFKLYFTFIIVLVGGIVVLSNCSLFLVFRIWESIAIVNVSTTFLVLGGHDNAKIVNMCCSEAVCFWAT